MLEHGDTERVNVCKRRHPHTTTVAATVKKDRSVDTLHVRALNNSIAKYKYQTPKLEKLMDMIAENFDGKRVTILVSRHGTDILTGFI